MVATTSLTASQNGESTPEKRLFDISYFSGYASHATTPLGTGELEWNTDNIHRNFDPPSNNKANWKISCRQIFVSFACLIIGLLLTYCTFHFFVLQYDQKIRNFHETECEVTNQVVGKKTCSKQACAGEVRGNSLTTRSCYEQVYYTCYYAKWELMYFKNLKKKEFRKNVKQPKKPKNSIETAAEKALSKANCDDTTNCKESHTKKDTLDSTKSIHSFIKDDGTWSILISNLFLGKKKFLIFVLN